MYWAMRVGFFLMVGALILGPSSLEAAWVDNGVPLCTEQAYQGNPSMISDAEGGAIVVWWDSRNSEEHDLYAQRVDAEGNTLWDPDGVPICVQPGDQYAAAIVSDGAGGAIITWHDERSCAACWDIYVQRIDGTGDPLWDVDGVLVCGASAYQTYPRIVSDGNHGAIIAWEDQRGYVAKDIYAQRVDGSSNLLWAPDGVPICRASATQENLEMIPDGSGGAYLTWQDARSGGMDYWDIYAQRVNAAGTPYWAPNGIRICGAVDDQQWPAIVADGVGGAIITWSDSRNGGDYDIYAQRVGPDGVGQWPGTNGVSVCAVSGAQYSPLLASDGQHGAIVVWRDLRGADSDIYAQRAAADGTAMWPAGGVIICAASGDQFGAGVIEDGVGGAIVVWEDQRLGMESADVLAQHVDAVGNTLWATGGKVISAAPYGQRFVVAAPDASGGAIVAWQDYRNNISWDIYAQSTQYIPQSAVEDGMHGVDGRGGSSYPNPSSVTMSIPFELEEASTVSLKIYDTSGRLVRTISEAYREAGSHCLTWDGRDADGREVARGAYICHLSGTGPEITHKVIRTR